MTSLNQSCAILTAIATYEDPRPVPDKPNTILLDTQIYLGSKILIGLLRYYNGDGIRFSDAGVMTFTATISRIWKDTEAHSEKLSSGDYDLEGDITWVTTIGTGLELRQLKKLVRIDRLPSISISGQAVRRNTKAFTFDVDVFQYTSFGRGLSPLPITVIIPDSGKYKQSNKRPMPGENAFVTVVGPMTHVIGEDRFQRRFGVELDKVSFLCRANGNSMSTKAANVKPVADSSAQKMRIDFTELLDTGFKGEIRDEDLLQITDNPSPLTSPEPEHSESTQNHNDSESLPESVNVADPPVSGKGKRKAVDAEPALRSTRSRRENTKDVSDARAGPTTAGQMVPTSKSH